MRVFVIGCGGGGTYTIDHLKKVVKPSDITAVDGDVFERKNLDRQRFDEKYIGVNKAAAMALMHGCHAIGEYFHADSIPDLDWKDVIFCEVDNHPARREVLKACDQFGCQCVISANELTDAESYWYHPDWKDTPNDPRFFYPVILTDRSGDPLGPPGCVEAQQERPQGALVNQSGTALAMQLFAFHTSLKKRFKEARDMWPVHSKQNIWGFKTFNFGHKMADASLLASLGVAQRDEVAA